MRGPLLCLATSALILNVALLPSLFGVQAQASPAHDVQLDGAVPPADARANAADASENGTLAAEADRTFLRIDVYENGTADWRIEYWVRLEDRTAEQRFRQSDRTLDQGTTASDRYYARLERSVAAAERATDRNMSATGFRTHTTVRQLPEQYGVVVYSFRWDGFANASSDRLRIGDALQGLYLGSGEHLLISWPEDYELAEVDPAPDATKEQSVVWHGPTVFGLDGPRLLVTDRSGSLTGLFPVSMAAVAVVAALWWVRRSGETSLPPPAVRAGTDEREAAELLSNEEQVLRFLEDNGGRVKQHTVTDEFGWTPSKTSYVVSTLREEGEIHTFRLGRENVLALPDSQTAEQPNT